VDNPGNPQIWRALGANFLAPERGEYDISFRNPLFLGEKMGFGEKMRCFRKKALAPPGAEP
jgi:hypothetical protein